MNDMGTSMLEAEAVMCGAVGELLERTGAAAVFADTALVLSTPWRGTSD